LVGATFRPGEAGQQAPAELRRRRIADQQTDLCLAGELQHHGQGLGAPNEEAPLVVGPDEQFERARRCEDQPQDIDTGGLALPGQRHLPDEAAQLGVLDVLEPLPHPRAARQPAERPLCAGVGSRTQGCGNARPFGVWARGVLGGGAVVAGLLPAGAGGWLSSSSGIGGFSFHRSSARRPMGVSRLLPNGSGSVEGISADPSPPGRAGHFGGN
jgi:hypothetical protein